MIANDLEALIDRIALACWSHELREPCELQIKDVEVLLRAFQLERSMTDILYLCVLGKANGPQIAHAIRLYNETRNP